MLFMKKDWLAGILLLILCFVAGPLRAEAIEVDEQTFVQEKFSDAMQLFERGKVDAAIYMLQQVHEKYPTNVDVLLALGEMAISTKNWAYAIYVLDKVAKLRPDDTEVRHVLMEIYRAYQMPIQEIMTGKEIIAIDPTDMVALRKLAFLYRDQGMPDDEIEIRQIIAEQEPVDYENLQELAFLHWKMGEIFEEILIREDIQERFPQDFQNLKRLARLYHIDGDRFSKLEVLDTLRDDVPPQDDLPEELSFLQGEPRYSNETREDHRKTYKNYKKALTLYHSIRPEFYYSRNASDYDQLDTIYGGNIYHFLRLSEFSTIGADLGYEHFIYTPKKDLTGEMTVYAPYIQLFYHNHYWRRQETSLRLHSGVQHITTSGTIKPARYLDVEDMDDYPMLEPRDFGGTVITGGLELDKKFNRAFGMRFETYSDVIRDLDAFIRLKGEYVGAIETYYTRPDESWAALRYEYAKATDGNDRHRAMLGIFYPLYISNSMYDSTGKRVGHLHSFPKFRIDAEYQLSFRDDRKRSPYYDCFSSEWKHVFNLYSTMKIRHSLHLRAEGLYAKGDLVKEAFGMKVGFDYDNPDTYRRIQLLYVWQKDETVDPIRHSITESEMQHGVVLKIVWHLGAEFPRD